MYWTYTKLAKKDIFCYNFAHGALAQLGERHAGSVEVAGSSPACSTNQAISIALFGFSSTTLTF